MEKKQGKRKGTNSKQKYKNHGTKKHKEQIKSKRGTKI
jgi:hypothetical protein